MKFSGIDFKEDFESCMGNATFAFRPRHHCLVSLALLLANMRDSQTSCLGSQFKSVRKVHIGFISL